MKEYRVLTVWQPWATLLVAGIKKIETRPEPTSWTNEKGTYLIHAASKWSRMQEKICQTEPFRTALGITLGLKKFKDLPLGAIIGAVEVEECFEVFTGIEIDEIELLMGDYSNGRYGWLCENPRQLITPIPYKNNQGFYQRYKGDESLLIFK